MFRTREMFVKQHTQLIKAVRALLTDYGIVLPLQRRNGQLFAKRCRSEFGTAPEIVTSMIEVYLKQVEAVDVEVAELDLSTPSASRRLLTGLKPPDWRCLLADVPLGVHRSSPSSRQSRRSRLIR